MMRSFLLCLCDSPCWWTYNSAISEETSKIYWSKEHQLNYILSEQMKLIGDILIFEEKHLVLFSKDCLKSKSARCLDLNSFMDLAYDNEQSIVSNSDYRYFNGINLILRAFILSYNHWILFVFDCRQKKKILHA